MASRGVTSRLAITAAMTATHTAAQAASAADGGGAGPTGRRAASGHARGPRERASAIPGRRTLAASRVPEANRVARAP